MANSNFYLELFNELQDSYSELINNLFKKFGPRKTIIDCAIAIDKIHSFWLEKSELLLYIWNGISETNDCFILSSAPNLDVVNRGHFPFSSVGNLQILFDPFIKIEPLFRTSISEENSPGIIKRFNSIIDDTLTILADYRENFYFVSQDALTRTTFVERMENNNRIFPQFVLSLFAGKFRSIDEFFEECPTFDSIQEIIPENVLRNLIFSDFYDTKITLKQRLERFVSDQNLFDFKKISNSEAKVFYSLLFGQFSQSIETLTCICSIGAYPFIRNEVPLNYFDLLFRNLEDDYEKRECYKKTWIGFYTGELIYSLDLVDFKFDNFSEIIRLHKPYDQILSKLDETSDFSHKDIHNTVTAVFEKIGFGTNSSIK